MDFSDPKVWTDGLGVVISAPQIVGPLVVLAAGAGYWLKSEWAKSEKEGLVQRVGVLEQRVQLAEEHSQFAREREEDVKRERDEVRKQFRKLKAQIAAGAPKEKLAETSAKVDTALRNLSTANNALASAIREPAFRPWMDDVTDRSGTPLPARVSATLPSEKK